MIWACPVCTYHNLDTDVTCAMCNAPVPAIAEPERDIKLALLTMSHCNHCLGVVGTNCSCGLQCAKGPSAKCIGDPVLEAIQRRDRERAEELERQEQERLERAAEEQRALEARASNCNMCNAKLMPGYGGTCNQCHTLGCPRLNSEGGPQGALVQERFMQQQAEHSARVHAQWAAQGIMSRNDSSLSASAASLAAGRGWGNEACGGSSGTGSGGGGRGRYVPFEGGPMDTATFRKRMEAAGSPVLPGQDVCHIIAKSNGGADHSDNYFIAGSAYNRSTGNNFDHIIAYIAGLQKTERAVAVSRRTGYRGPDARELVEKGREEIARLRNNNLR